MDPFEEFEFKPLTKGLGFHQNNGKPSLSQELQTKSDLPESVPVGLLDEEPVAPRNQAEAYKDLMKALRKESDLDIEENSPVNESSQDLELSEPLPRKSDTPTLSAMDMGLPDLNPTPEIPPIAEISEEIENSSPALPSTFDVPRVEKKNSTTQRGASNAPKPDHLEPAPVSFSAAVLDFVFVIALAGIFLVSLLLVTSVPLENVLFNIENDLFTRLSFAVLLVAVMQMYIVVARSFFGRTLGEWTFDLQMGTDDDIESPLYPLRIVLRSLMTVVTGLITLSCLSFLFQTDLAAKLTGVQLYRHR